MRKMYEWDVKVYRCPCGCGLKSDDWLLGGIELTDWQKEAIGLTKVRSAVHVSNVPVRGWKQVVIEKIVKLPFGDGEWCRRGLKNAGIIPKEGRSLWVKVVEHKKKEAIKCQ